MGVTREQRGTPLANFSQLLQNLDIDPATVSITGTEGVDGGGDLTTSKQLYLAIQTLANIGMIDAANDLLLVYDISDGVHKVTTPSAIAAAGADLSFVHIQGSPASVWNVNHNLGKFPSVSVVDTAKNKIQPDVQYIDINNVTLTFSGNTSGEAYFN